jgi:putative glutathione S-transferase
MRWRVTETDIRAFVTLVRFDLAYCGLFKCNLAQVRDYPQVFAYLMRLWAQPAFQASVDVDHIRRGYYSINALNPSGIVPFGPRLDLTG